MASTREPTPNEERRQDINPSAKGGEEALRSPKVSASELQLYLKGVSYPANKQNIVSAARQNGAPSNVMNWINRLPDKQYGGPNMVEEEFGKMK